jgi:Cyclin, C-terminal domain
MGGLPPKLRVLAEYMGELALLHDTVLLYPPSLIAAAAIQVANQALGSPLPASVIARCGEQEQMLGSCMASLRENLVWAWRHDVHFMPAVKEKYSSAMKYSVATMPPCASASLAPPCAMELISQ